MAHCKCCGQDSLEEGNGNFEICPICSWEDDPVQGDDADYWGGANTFTLRHHRSIYLIIHSVINSNIVEAVNEEDNPYDANEVFRYMMRKETRSIRKDIP